jgi:hypothetical protein
MKSGSTSAEAAYFRCLMPHVLPFLIVLFVATILHAADLPAQIKNDLTANAKSLSPLSVTWRQEIRSLVPEAKAVESFKLPNPLPREYLTPRQCQLSFSGIKIRASVETSLWGLREQSFDGDILYIGNHDNRSEAGAVEPQPTLSKNRIQDFADERPNDNWITMDYFATTGFWFPQTSLELSQRVPPESALLKLLSTKGKLISVSKPDAAGLIRVLIEAPDPTQQRFANIDLKAIESQMRNGLNTEEHIQRELDALKRLQALPHNQRFAFYLDTARRHAVVRYQELTQNDEVLLDARHDKFEKIERRDLWLPRRSLINYHTWVSIAGIALKDPVLQRVIEVSSIQSPAADFAFALDYQHVPSANIYDNTGEKRTITRVPGR